MRGIGRAGRTARSPTNFSLYTPPASPPPLQLATLQQLFRCGSSSLAATTTMCVAGCLLHAPCARSPSLSQVLSLGEGQGRNAVHLASLGHSCTAVDSSAVGLQKAMGLASDRGVRKLVSTVAADLTTFDPSAAPLFLRVPPPEQQWGAIVSIFCALPADHRRRLHRACAAALWPGGLVIIECFGPGQAQLCAGGQGGGGRSWQRTGPPDELLISVDDLAQVRHASVPATE